MRVILCESCGKLKPTPPEDIAAGITTRRVTGTVSVSVSVHCDYCNEPLNGKKAVALSSPADMREWEDAYMTI